MTASVRSAALAPVAALLLLGGCATPRDQIKVSTTTARPQPVLAADRPTGAIFRTQGNLLLFEDYRPRAIGDLLTIQLNETLNASQSATSNTEKKTSATAVIPKIKGVFGMGINGLNTTAATDNSFNGTGATTSSGLFTGTITVTVIEVLDNGNLMVAGEKQIGIRENSEILRFSGTVNPALIQYGNVVSSTQVADARLDYRGGGNIEQAQIQGWLGRFFNSWSPF
ncbi:MAG TPA: flagellar basal body L-ring protein FlgH [Burkholderiaceae bacterium]|jgi:flagellar L-ring protein precursor FlgH|nr:flagellar basal body L-ring protein FlgH [Burkholderiaceae bacterium]